jgi:hypothetical protein
MVPLILWQFIGILALAVIIPGLSIVPPPTTAYDTYHKAEIDFNSVSAYNPQNFTINWDNREKKMNYLRVMVQLQSPANAEARDATRNLASQLIRNPVMRAFLVGMLVLWIIASLWSGILLTFGMRHALALSIEGSAVITVVFLICLWGLLAFVPRFLFGSILWPA